MNLSKMKKSELIEMITNMKAESKPVTPVKPTPKPVDEVVFGKFMNIFVSRITAKDINMNARVTFNDIIIFGKTAGHKGLAKDLISAALSKGYMRYDKRNGKPMYGLSVHGKKHVMAHRAHRSADA